MTNKPQQNNQNIARRAIFLVVLLFVITLAVVFMLWSTSSVEAVGLLPLSLHSKHNADYSSDAQTSLPAIDLKIIAEAIRDANPDADITARMVNLTAVLSAPIPSATLANSDRGILTSLPAPSPNPTSDPTSMASPFPIPTSIIFPSATFVVFQATATYRPYLTPTHAPTRRPTDRPTSTRTNGPSPTTPNITQTRTPAVTVTPTPTATKTASSTPTATTTATVTPTLAPTHTPTVTKTATSTPSLTITPSIPPSYTSTVTQTATVTPTPTVTVVAPVTVTPTVTQTAVSGLPACVDPLTVTGILPSDDTYIDPSEPNDPTLGSKKTFTARSGAIPDERGLLRFDLSAIPANATITSATLYLYELDDRAGVVAQLYRVTTPWTESTATWNSPWITPGGDFSTDSYSSFLVDHKNCMASINLAALVQDWVSQKYPNYGFMIYMTGQNHKFEFVSKEEDGNLEQRPRLSISYTVAYQPPFMDFITRSVAPHFPAR